MLERKEDHFLQKGKKTGIRDTWSIDLISYKVVKIGIYITYVKTYKAYKTYKGLVNSVCYLILTRA